MKHSIKIFLLSIVAIAAILVLLFVLLLLVVPSDENEAQRTHIRENVEWAKISANTAVDSHIEELKAFFEERKNGAEEFADAANSWKSKGKMIWAHLPFTDSEGHDKYIRKKFEELIISDSLLQSKISYTCTAILQDIEQIENELAAKLQNEIDGKLNSPDDIHEGFVDSLIHYSNTGSNVAKSVGNDVGSLVVGEVATQVLTRLGISAGILGTGAASGWATFGIGMAAGIVVDWVWGLVSNPEGKIKEETIKALDSVCLASTSAVQEEMRRVVSEKSSLWDKTANAIINELY
jgi:hypothetical protein